MGTSKVDACTRGGRWDGGLRVQLATFRQVIHEDSSSTSSPPAYRNLFRCQPFTFMTFDLHPLRAIHKLTVSGFKEVWEVHIASHACPTETSSCPSCCSSPKRRVQGQNKKNGSDWMTFLVLHENIKNWKKARVHISSLWNSGFNWIVDSFFFVPSNLVK